MVPSYTESIKHTRELYEFCDLHGQELTFVYILCLWGWVFEQKVHYLG
jgi:hypothetical protein